MSAIKYDVDFLNPATASDKQLMGENSETSDLSYSSKEESHINILQMGAMNIFENELMTKEETKEEARK